MKYDRNLQWNKHINKKEVAVYNECKISGSAGYVTVIGEGNIERESGKQLAHALTLCLPTQYLGWLSAEGGKYRARSTFQSN